MHQTGFGLASLPLSIPSSARVLLLDFSVLFACNSTLSLLSMHEKQAGKELKLQEQVISLRRGSEKKVLVACLQRSFIVKVFEREGKMQVLSKLEYKGKNANVILAGKKLVAVWDSLKGKLVQMSQYSGLLVHKLEIQSQSMNVLAEAQEDAVIILMQDHFENSLHIIKEETIQLSRRKIGFEERTIVVDMKRVGQRIILICQKVNSQESRPQSWIYLLLGDHIQRKVQLNPNKVCRGVYLVNRYHNLMLLLFEGNQPTSFLQVMGLERLQKIGVCEIDLLRNWVSNGRMVVDLNVQREWCVRRLISPMIRAVGGLKRRGGGVQRSILRLIQSQVFDE